MPLIFAVICVTASLVFACLALIAGRSQRGLSINPKQHDFGNVEPGQLSETFLVTNHATCPIKVKNVSLGCGYIRLSFPAKQLASGESVSVLCEIDTRGRRGAFTSHFTIVYAELTDQSMEQSVQCVLRANVDSLVGIDPADVRFQIGANETKRVRISSSQVGIRVKAVRCEHPAIRSEVVEDGAATDLTFDAPRWTDQENSVVVDIETTCESERTVRLPVYILKSRQKT